MAKRRVETMEENRNKLIAVARRAFAEKGYAALVACKQLF